MYSMYRELIWKIQNMFKVIKTISGKGVELVWCDGFSFFIFVVCLLEWLKAIFELLLHILLLLNPILLFLGLVGCSLLIYLKIPVDSLLIELILLLLLKRLDLIGIHVL